MSRLSLAEIVRLDSAEPPLPYHIDQLQWRGSKNIYAGDSGTYKTWAQISASLSIASGAPVWGRFAVPEPGPVVYVAYEGMRRKVLEEVTRVACGLGVKANEVPFYLWFREPIELKHDHKQVAVDLKALEAVRVVFDPLVLASTHNEMEPSDWRAHVFDPVEHIIDNTDCTVDLTHHVNKLSLIQKVPGKVAVRGWSGFPAWADTVLVATRSEAGLQIEHAKMRSAPELGTFNLTVAFHDASMVRVLCDMSDDPIERNKAIDRAIVMAVAQAITPLSQSELVQEAKSAGGASRREAEARIKALVADKVLAGPPRKQQGQAHRYGPGPNFTVANFSAAVATASRSGEVGPKLVLAK